MTFRILRRAFLAALLSLTSVGVPFASAAQDDEVPPDTRRVPTISELVFKRLSKVQEAVDAKEFDVALEELRDMERMRGLNEYEIASMANMEAFVMYTREDYPAAIRAYEKVIAQGDKIPRGLELATLYSLSQLYFVQEDYRKSLQYLDQWFDLNPADPGPRPYVFKAQVLYSMEDFRAGIPVIETAMDKARQAGQPIEENWWLLLRVFHYELENWQEVLNILEVLVREFPKREYWIQLAGVYGQEERLEEQLGTMEAAYVQGHLERERDILNYTGLLMQEGVPARAARVLDRAIEDGIVEDSAKNLQMLGQAWQVSAETERAIPVFEDAAEKSDEGDIYGRLAQLYLDRDDHEQAIRAADLAFEKGGLRNPSDIYVVKGMSLFETDRLDQALTAFREAQRIARRENDRVGQNIARQWLSYVESESERRRRLRESTGAGG